MTKVLYMAGNASLSDDERAAYSGCRMENAAYFGGVATGVTEAAVAGDYPEIMEALQAADIETEVIKLECDGGEPPEVSSEPEAVPEPVLNGAANEDQSESKPDQETGKAGDLTDEQKTKVLESVQLLAQDSDKKPNVTAVEELTGFDINAADRDEAWAKHQNK